LIAPLINQSLEAQATTTPAEDFLGAASQSINQFGCCFPLTKGQVDENELRDEDLQSSLNFPELIKL
jgi:hypothetical protein